MSLVEFQKALLTLYTDEYFRDLFFSHWEKALAGYSLTGREKRALGNLAEERVKTFSKELVHKRIDVARKILKKINPQGEPVILFPVYRRGPILFFLHKDTETETPLSQGMLSLFSEIAKKQTPLSYKAIIRAALNILVSAKDNTSINEPSFSDLIQAMRIIRTYCLSGKLIRRTL